MLIVSVSESADNFSTNTCISVETGSGHPGQPGQIFSGSNPVYKLSGSDPDWIT